MNSFRQRRSPRISTVALLQTRTPWRRRVAVGYSAPRMSCATLRAYVAQYGAQQARQMGRAVGMTASEEPGRAVLGVQSPSSLARYYE